MQPIDRRDDEPGMAGQSPGNSTYSGATGTDATGNTTEQIKQDLETVKAGAQHDLEAIREKAAEDVRTLKHEASAQVDKATDKAKGFASDQKDLAATQLDGVAQALDKVAGELEGGDQAAIGRYAHDLASGAQRLSQQIRERDVDQLMQMAQDFGRKQPVAFLGAAALLGFAATRFATASSHRDSAPSSSASPSRGTGYTGTNRTDDDALTPSEDRFQTAGTGRADNVYGQ
jgi:hypothetical protein